MVESRIEDSGGEIPRSFVQLRIFMHCNQGDAYTGVNLYTERGTTQTIVKAPKR